MKFDEVLKSFADFLRSAEIRFAIIGGLALQALGHSRPTYDADFVVDGRRRDDVIAFAGTLGYQTNHASEGYSNHDHPVEAFGHVDFMYVYGATAETVFATAEPRVVVGIELPVTQPEVLVAMKVRAMRNAPHRVLIDAPDIAFLLTIPGIDRERVREYFVEHGLLKIYDELEKERRRLV